MSRWFRTYGFAEITDELLIGAYPLDEDDVEMLARLGVKRVLNLVEDEEYGSGRARLGRGRARGGRNRGAPAEPRRLRRPARRAARGGHSGSARRGSTRACAATSTAAPAGSARRPSPRASSRSATGSTSTRRSSTSSAASRRPTRCPTSARTCGWWDEREVVVSAAGGVARAPGRWGAWGSATRGGRRRGGAWHAAGAGGGRGGCGRAAEEVVAIDRGMRGQEQPPNRRRTRWSCRP